MSNKIKVDSEAATAADTTLGCANQPEFELAGGMRLSKWCAAVGISRTKCWRLRKAGKLPVVIRFGTPYVTPRRLANFSPTTARKLEGRARVKTHGPLSKTFLVKACFPRSASAERA
jgi:hypothetical protein